MHNLNIVKTADGKVFRLEPTGELVMTNTGLAVAWAIDSAVDLIRKNPSGPKADSNSLIHDYGLFGK